MKDRKALLLGVGVLALVAFAPCRPGASGLPLAEEAHPRATAPTPPGAAGPAPQAPIPTPPRVILQSLIEAALAFSPAIMAASSRAEGESHLAASAHSFPSPAVVLGFSPSPVETREGPQRFRASVEQTFPFPGKRGLRGDVSEARVHRLRAQRDAAAAEVVRKVKEAFWEIYRIDRASSSARREQELLSDIVSAARTRYETGQGNQANLFQAELMRTRLENRLLLLQGMREEAARKLSGVIGRPAEVPFAARLDEAATSPDISRVGERVLETNPDYLAAEEAVRTQDFSLRLAGRDFYPDITLRAGWLEVADEGQGGRDAWSLDAMIRLPFLRGDLRGRARAQEAALRAARQDRDDLGARLIAEAEGLVNRLRSLAESINLYRTGLLPQAESTYESAMASYITGELGFADLILAEQTFLDVELELDETVSLYQRTMATLEALMGAASPESPFSADPRP